MTTKKKAEPKAEKKPAVRRAPRKEPPLDEKDILFCHFVMRGSPDPKTSQLDRIEAAGAKLGYSKSEASKVYHRKKIQAYLDKYRERMMVEMCKNEVRTMHNKGYSR